jgi:hypothetical protein
VSNGDNIDYLAINGTVPSYSTSIQSNPDWNSYTYKVPEQLTLFPELESLPFEDEDDELAVIEEVTIEREYDDEGRMTKETRTVSRPRQRKLEPRTPPLAPRPRPTPWVDPQPWIQPPQQQEWHIPHQPYWTPNTYPGQHQIWCSSGVNGGNNPHQHFIN